MTDLPPGWEWARFSDVASVASDLVSPVDHQSAPHIAPNHIQSQTGKLLEYTTVAADGVTSPKHRFVAGLILYSKIRPYLAKAVVVDFAGLCSADMYPIDCDIDPRYLHWWMLSQEFTRAASEQQGRSLLPKINSMALGKLPIPVAPRAEQRRIVAALEEHLSRLESGIGTLTRAGKRVTSLQSAHLSQEIQQLGVTSVPLGSLLREPLANGRSVPTQRGGFPVLRLNALQSWGVDLSQRKDGAWVYSQAKPFLVEQSDFFIGRGNGSLSLVGRGSLLNDDPDAVAFPDTMIRIRPDKSRLMPAFLHRVWGSRVIRRQIESAARTSAGIYKVNHRSIERIEVPLPALSEQARFLAVTGDCRSAAEQLGQELNTVVHRGEVLRRSLLSEAFAGRLVAQETNDEPASELLARIRAEREAQPATRRTRRSPRTSEGGRRGPISGPAQQEILP